MSELGTLRMPEVIYYGQNSFQQVGIEAAKRGKKALIVSDPIMKNLGYVDRCVAYLQAHRIDHAIFWDVQTEPVDTYVSDALSLLAEERCDLIISIGGGSCIDTAKAVAVVETNGGYIGDYVNGNRVADKAPIPHIAIPTTAGTGSEATDVTVITNTNNDVKMMIKQPAFMPNVAIVDALLTVSSPRTVTAATGLDALTHAIEAYISKKAHPLTDMFALQAMERIVPHIRNAYNDRDDLTAREEMAIGACLAGTAFSNASVCLVHGMSRPLGALFHVPHGISNAMLLPAVLEYTQDACTERLAHLGKLFARGTNEPMDTNELAAFAVAEVKRLCVDLNIPNLNTWGIDSQQFADRLDKMVHDAFASGSPDNHPLVPTAQEMKALYQRCYDYKFSQERP